MRPTPLLVLVILLVAATSWLGCQTPGAGEVPDSPLEATADVYLAYERGNCEAVEARREFLALDEWPVLEVRSSFLLVTAFCAERADEPGRAREIYRRILREAPLSFAADDARERLRVLRMVENDPEYGDWVAQAKIRALQGSTDRLPVERPAALYPPLARFARIGGYAVVEFGVTPRGDTDAPVVVDAEPPLLFDGAALRAVREWRYARDADGTGSQRQAIRLVFEPEAAPTPDLDQAVDAEAN